MYLYSTCLPSALPSALLSVSVLAGRAPYVSVDIDLLSMESLAPGTSAHLVTSSALFEEFRFSVRFFPLDFRLPVQSLNCPCALNIGRKHVTVCTIKPQRFQIQIPQKN